jgi:hypothetical protein
MYHKDSILHPRKIDWMLLQRRDELRNIMQDNGEYFFGKLFRKRESIDSSETRLD